MILVTGASGFAGGSLVRALLAENQSVRVLVRHDRKAIEGLPVEQIEGDITDPDTMLRACRGVDVVYHLAAMISLETRGWKQVEAVNVGGTHHVVEACLRCNVRRLVYFSSIHALSQYPLSQPVNENNPPALSPIHSPYDRSKASAEREVRAGLTRGLDAIILNPTAMVGPFDFKPSYFGQGVLMMARGKIPALIKGGFDWVDVRDVATAALVAERLAPTGASYIIGGHWHSVREIAQIVAEVTGRRAPLFTVPMRLAYAVEPGLHALAKLTNHDPIYTRVTLQSLQSNHHISHARAEQELGYQPRPFRETLTDTIHWFSDNGMLK